MFHCYVYCVIKLGTCAHVVRDSACHSRDPEIEPWAIPTWNGRSRPITSVRSPCERNRNSMPEKEVSFIIIIYYLLLFIICYLLFVICYLLFVICYLLFVICYYLLLFVIIYYYLLLFIIYILLLSIIQMFWRYDFLLSL